MVAQRSNPTPDITYEPTYDDLGNRKNVNVRSEFDVTYSVDANTNRYTVINGVKDALGYWKMDDNDSNTNVVDSSGDGYHGTFNDATGDANTSAHHIGGKVTSALDFSGDDGVYLEGTSGHDSPFNIYDTDIAISAWVKIRGGGTIVARAKGGYITYMLGVMGGRAFINTYKGGSGHWILYGDQILDANIWYHLVGVFDRDGDKGYVYVNGVKDGEASMTTDPLSNDAITRIGCRNSTSDSAINAVIDDVRVFDKTLSGDEIQTLFNCGNLSYDAAGNLTQDQRGYEYEYDYESRIVKITKGTQTKAEFAYDALGRRIRKIDSVASETTLYYHNYNWQVLAEYDGAGSYEKLFIYGNYIDEVLYTQGTGPANQRYYVHDHLYSPVALVYAGTGTVIERYEYDAYGSPTIWNADFTTERANSNYGNPYLFTGRRVDILDSGSLKIQYNRNCYYDYYSGRWLTHDPLGITPNPQQPNTFDATSQYKDRMSLYQYVDSNPAVAYDPWGLYWMPGPGIVPRMPECGMCGPDVTSQLTDVINKVVADYNTMPRSEKKRHCDALYDTSTRGSAWEIFQLRGRSWIEKQFPCCATKPQCKGTVEVSGKCYHASDVNYLLWGVTNKLCGNWWAITKAAIYIHKAKYWHLPKPQTIDWAKLGHRHLSDWSSHPVPTSRHKHCDTRCGGHGVPPFTYKWDEDTGGIDWIDW